MYTDTTKFIGEGLTYDDVLLVPSFSDILPREVKVDSRFSRNITLNIPMVSAAMDTVTEAAMAIGMAQEGGIGVLHKNMSIERQANEVRKVKRSENGMIVDPVTLDKDLQYRINIFLSNFSEQSFLNMKLSTAPDDQLMKFVWIYCKINHGGAISYDGSFETIPLGTMNEYLNRFFGLTRSPANGASYMLDQWNSFSYHDGKFWFPAASGESYNKFTVVDSMKSNGDGTYTVDFQVYELGLEEYWNTPGIDNSYYWLNSEQVSAKVWDYKCMPVQGGTAVVRDFTYNGRATFQLISYEIWDIEFSY